MMRLVCYPTVVALLGALATGDAIPNTASAVSTDSVLAAKYDRAVLDKCSARLTGVIDSSSQDKPLRVWVFFAGHGRLSRAPEEVLSKRSMERRSLRAGAAHDRFDMPVCRYYIDAVRDRSIGIRHVSRYFNAVSALVEPSRIASICSLPFVARVDCVAVYRREDTGRPRAAPLPLQSDDPLVGTYGGSLDQLIQIRAADLLELGYNGSGTVTSADPVLVCVMDTGFRLDHEAFDNISIVGQWDFVQGDSIVSNEAGDHAEQDRHGSVVLGALAGYHLGNLVGPAWGADFLLAKTEIVGTEIEVEEDNWIAGLEWADSAGADSVSSSLGYVDWYTPSMLDGYTPRCTQAADIAAAHGVLVVTAMGNGGLAGDSTLIAPADGDSVIAIGAVDRNGVIAYFSSRGPTADGRIKPDVVALGLGVHTVEYPTVDSYARYNGTSLATPLVSGLCAQILEIFPELSPIEVWELLTSTSSRSNDPDNVYGYGLPDGVAAASVEVPEEPATIVTGGAYPNPFRTSTKFDITIPISEPLTVRIYDCRGALVKELIAGRILPWGGTLNWDGTNGAGSRVAAGVYFMHFSSRHFDRTFKVLLIP
jgi:serine protease AprX